MSANSTTIAKCAGGCGRDVDTTKHTFCSFDCMLFFAKPDMIIQIGAD